MLGVVIAVQQIESHVLQPASCWVGRCGCTRCGDPRDCHRRHRVGHCGCAHRGAGRGRGHAVGHHLLASNSAAPEDVDDVLTPAQPAEVATDVATTKATAAIEAADD